MLLLFFCRARSLLWQSEKRGTPARHEGNEIDDKCATSLEKKERSQFNSDKWGLRAVKIWGRVKCV